LPAITNLIRLISLDATTNLVNAGLVSLSGTIVAASNATPIVVTTSVPHLILGSPVGGGIVKASVVVSGVTGNTAANGTFVAHVVDGSNLALYAVDANGNETPVAGSGAYAGGGLVQTAFADGEIVVGRARQGENFAPPRCVFVPKGFRFGPRSTANRNALSTASNPQGGAVRSYSMTQYGGGYSSTPTVVISVPDLPGGTQAAAVAIVSSTNAIIRLVPTVSGSGYLNPPSVVITDPTGSQAAATANLGPPPEALAQMSQRALLTEWDQFEVQVWGISTPGESNYDVDFDATQAIYQQVVASTHRLCAGVSNFLTGVWADSRPNAPQMTAFGHMAIFNVEIATPVLDLAVQYAPVGVRPVATLQSVDRATGQVEVGLAQTM
jgi:hypothetical protein